MIAHVNMHSFLCLICDADWATARMNPCCRMHFHWEHSIHVCCACALCVANVRRCEQSCMTMKMMVVAAMTLASMKMGPNNIFTWCVHSKLYVAWRRDENMQVSPNCKILGMNAIVVGCEGGGWLRLSTRIRLLMKKTTNVRCWWDNSAQWHKWCNCHYHYQLSHTYA